ncbi:MAG: putative cysteine cluster protein YcgN (CxxCxxCC family) [Halieaceae bacterium]
MFWENLSLSELDRDQWEALCDGCGKCCLHKLEDEQSQTYQYTAVACKLLDLDSCRCSDYSHRKKRVEHCLDLYSQFQSGDRQVFEWLPTSCAYRLRDKGQALPPWHHLISGDRDSVHDSDNSVRDKVVSGEYVHPEDADQFIIHWIET